MGKDKEARKRADWKRNDRNSCKSERSAKGISLKIEKYKQKWISLFMLLGTHAHTHTQSHS